MKNILLIEDNPLNQRLFCDVLCAYGAKVLTANDAFEAIKQLKKETPDLILMDIGLPHISGLTLCQHLKRVKKIKSIPIIAITAFACYHEKEKLLHLGFEDVLIKPINLKLLIKLASDSIS